MPFSMHSACEYFHGILVAAGKTCQEINRADEETPRIYKRNAELVFFARNLLQQTTVTAEQNKKKLYFHNSPPNRLSFSKVYPQCFGDVLLIKQALIASARAV